MQQDIISELKRIYKGKNEFWNGDIVNLAILIKRMGKVSKAGIEQTPLKEHLEELAGFSMRWLEHKTGLHGEDLIEIIKAERKRQDDKFGKGSMRYADELMKTHIIMEEIGELSEEILVSSRRIGEELVQVTACAFAWLEAEVTP